MLRKLRISNYALIDHLELELNKGFTVITGETGAGKSILLGALGLVLGNRADTSVLFDNNNKCYVEAVFEISHLKLKSFFDQNDLEYEPDCILRREISISGKSRAFINDSPVNLNTLKELGEFLVDIHSQHDSLHLTESRFQLQILDGLAENESVFKDYSLAFEAYERCKKELQSLKMMASGNDAEIALMTFQLQELERSNLNIEELDELEIRLNALTHAEEIRAGLYLASELLNRNDVNVIQHLRDAYLALSRIKQHLPQTATLAERLQTSVIEIKDISDEIENAEQKVVFDPDELDKINNRISILRQLLAKHQCRSMQELLNVKINLENKIAAIEKKDFNIENLTKTFGQLEIKLKEKASQLTASRKKMIPDMERSVNLLLTQLGMANAKFVANMSKSSAFTATGTDNLEFLFTANKGSQPENIAKVASGGELSRLMLAIKSLISNKKLTPTIIFDEIDSGVSGEIAAKVGRIMALMSHKMQLIAITHLPQIASKSSQHLLVFKRDDEKRTKTMLIQLNEQQHVDEIARMLSDDTITEVSRNAARELISGF
ncbi:MAG: DNA repair protein RecN [Bacteroidetes bacterium HGW-Bacteroidetes-1]|jgi:DNA repair protein RecN (Recombination protein N)|nr:MAG: DNA repair protein RecN [Bacteroidetes bacterium HGW-Bacteroidetes-1]